MTGKHISGDAEAHDGVEQKKQQYYFERNKLQQ